MATLTSPQLSTEVGRIGQAEDYGEPEYGACDHVCVLPVKYAVNIYQTLPKAGTIPKPPCHREVQTPTKCYQDPCSLSEIHWRFRFGHPTVYHGLPLCRSGSEPAADRLYQPLPPRRGTGHRLTSGRPRAPSRVGEYRHSGCHMGSMVKGYRSR